MCLSDAAWAEVESWNAVDVRIPLRSQHQTGLIPSRLNIFTIAQLAPRFDAGLGVLRYSMGPQWDINAQFSLALLGDVVYLGGINGKNNQEYRLNLEPVLRGKLLPELSWLDRSRIEYRWFPEHSSWRARNLIRLNWTGLSAGWIPYTAHEVFIEYPEGFTQSRHVLGIRHVIDQATQLDIGYMWRWRKLSNDSWDNDHVLMLFLFFAPPDAAQNVIGGE